MNRIDQVWLKVERAKQHIMDLKERVCIYRESKPYGIGTKPHEIAEIKHTTLYIASIRPIPNDFPLIIGDAVHNLRSSLDHLAWQLVSAGGGAPDKHTYFPICYGPQGSQQYASAIGSGEIKMMRPGAEKLIGAIQPYKTGDDTLWRINELDRIDKHRLVLTVIAILDEWRVRFTESCQIPFPESRALIVGDELVNLPTSTFEGTGHQNLEIGIDIAFGESEIVAGKPVLETLNKMADFVSGILPKFEPFLL